MDRIASVLEGYLKFARQQLELMRAGAKFDGIAGLSSTEEELLAWIAELEGSLARHQQRLQESR